MAYGDRRRDYDDMKTGLHRKQNNDKVEPSSVLFLRNLPNEVTEQEVAMIGAPFGRIRYLVLTKQRNQAFIEMEDFDGARRMSNYYLEHSPALRGANVQVQFSTHSSLKVEFDDTAVNMALHNANGVHEHVSRELAAGKRILFIQVENQSYPITLDVLHKIFSKFGFVEKIVLFFKDAKFSAFVQMSDTVEACVARVVLNGQNIYDGCCTLRIEFSKNKTLEVKTNTDKQRDYTRDDLPSDPSSGSVMGSSSAAGLASSSNSLANPISAMMSAFSSARNSNSAPNPGLMSNLTPQQVAFAALMAAAASGGNMNMEALMAAAAAAQAGFNAGADARDRGRDRDRSGDRYHDRSHRSRRRSHDWHSRSRSRSRSHSASRSRLRAAPRPASPRSDPRVLPRSQQLQTDAIREVSNTGEPGPCILVTNLDDQQITCEDLFNLFGSYGDVQRLKLLYKKKNTAILQFSDAQQAQIAMNMLHGQPLYDRRMRIVFSKHENIASPDQERNPEQALLLRDYTSSALHRFRKPGSKNYQNIFAPSATLHLSNIWAEWKGDRIRDLFIEKGFHVRNFRWLGTDHKQAFITLDSVDEGIMAVAKLHNFDFEQADRTHLKVSFSKQVDRPDFDR